MAENVLSKVPRDEAHRVAEVMRHAEALAERVERLPVPEDDDLRCARQNRLNALRWAVMAAEHFLGTADQPGGA